MGAEVKYQVFHLEVDAKDRLGFQTGSRLPADTAPAAKPSSPNSASEPKPPTGLLPYLREKLSDFLKSLGFSAAPAPKPARKSTRLAVEQLEDRVTPSSLSNFPTPENLSSPAHCLPPEGPRQAHASTPTSHDDAFQSFTLISNPNAHHRPYSVLSPFCELRLSPVPDGNDQAETAGRERCTEDSAAAPHKETRTQAPARLLEAPSGKIVAFAPPLSEAQAIDPGPREITVRAPVVVVPNYDAPVRQQDSVPAPSAMYGTGTEEELDVIPKDPPKKDPEPLPPEKKDGDGKVSMETDSPLSDAELAALDAMNDFGGVYLGDPQTAAPQEPVYQNMSWQELNKYDSQTVNKSSGSSHAGAGVILGFVGYATGAGVHRDEKKNLPDSRVLPKIRTI